MTTFTLFAGALLLGLFAGFIIGGSYNETKHYTPRKRDEL